MPEGAAGSEATPNPLLVREDSPICLIHFCHPFVYIESEDELRGSPEDSSSEELEGPVEHPALSQGLELHPDPELSLLPFESVLEGPSKDLLTQILFPDLKLSEDHISQEGGKEDGLSAVLEMLRDAWNGPRATSAGGGNTVATQTARRSGSNRRVLSAPETRIRRFALRSSAPSPLVPSCKSAPPYTPNAPLAPACKNNTPYTPLCGGGGEISSLPAMCTDSVICQQEGSRAMQPPCYCHSYTQNELRISCRMHVDRDTHITCTHRYNTFNNNYSRMLPDTRSSYHAKLVPRYSSLPRSLSMLANCSSPSTSTSSGSSEDEEEEEECQSLADSLEDISAAYARLSYDDKPVRGAPPLLPHRPAPRIPVPRSEKFFVPLAEAGDSSSELMLPPQLRAKLERRRQELESRPKPPTRSITDKNKNKKSPRPKRSRRSLGNRFQRFESIPEESESARSKGKFRPPVCRTYTPRGQRPGSRGLQAIMRDPHEAKVGLQDMHLPRPAVQSVIPVEADTEAAVQDLVPVAPTRRGLPLTPVTSAVTPAVTRLVPRGRQAVAPSDQDLVSVTTGWVNFYMLRGAESESAHASSDTTTTTTSSVTGRRTRRWTRGGRGARGGAASVTEVSVTNRSSTVRVQQAPLTGRSSAPRPLMFASATPRRAESEPEMASQKMVPLPRLPNSGDGRLGSGQQGSILPSLPGNRGTGNAPTVPTIRVARQSSSCSSSVAESISPDTGVSLPALPASTSPESPHRGRIVPARRSSSNSVTHAQQQASKVHAQNTIVATRSSRSTRNIRSQQQQQQLVPKSAAVTSTTTSTTSSSTTVVAETTTAPPGMWSVTVSGVCPQPEMEVRLVFPPNGESSGSTGPALPAPQETPALPAPLSTPPPALPSSHVTDTWSREEGVTRHVVDTEQAMEGRQNLMLAFKGEDQRQHTPPSPSRARNAVALRSKINTPPTSPQRRGSLKALPSPPTPPTSHHAVTPLRGGGGEVETRYQDDEEEDGEFGDDGDPVAPQVNDPEALQALMWPEMEAMLEEQVISIKKQHTRMASSATVVERLRGGETTDQLQELNVRGATIARRHNGKRRSSSMAHVQEY